MNLPKNVSTELTANTLTVIDCNSNQSLANVCLQTSKFRVEIPVRIGVVGLTKWTFWLGVTCELVYSTQIKRPGLFCCGVDSYPVLKQVIY